MEKIIVFGLGQDFECNKRSILQAFDVIACTDSFAVPKEEFWKGCYVPADAICNLDFEKILVCSRKYQDAIKVQLVKAGFPEDRIIYLDYLEKDIVSADFKEVIRDMELYRLAATDSRFVIAEDSLCLIADEKHKEAGTPCHHYFAQDIWGGNKIFRNAPERHYDIGSRLDGFIAHLLTFREVYYIDIRPLPYEIPGLHFVQGDATILSGMEDGSIESLSCLHAMEHFGLGRYGDKINPDAYRKAAESMQRVLRKGGHLYIGVPIGPADRLLFNAHRIFSVQTVLSLFEGMALRDIAIVEPEGVAAKPIGGQDYQDIQEDSCGLFEFVKTAE